ncbi:hypothetical protein ACX0G7_12200 [Flavitalea antarctica]
MRNDLFFIHLSFVTVLAFLSAGLVFKLTHGEVSTGMEEWTGRKVAVACGRLIGNTNKSPFANWSDDYIPISGRTGGGTCTHKSGPGVLYITASRRRRASPSR